MAVGRGHQEIPLPDIYVAPPWAHGLGLRVLFKRSVFDSPVSAPNPRRLINGICVIAESNRGHPDLGCKFFGAVVFRRQAVAGLRRESQFVLCLATLGQGIPAHRSARF